jgi:hypothetical protein
MSKWSSLRDRAWTGLTLYGWAWTRTKRPRGAGIWGPCFRPRWTPSPFLARPLVVLRRWPVLGMVRLLRRVRVGKLRSSLAPSLMLSRQGRICSYSARRLQMLYRSTASASWLRAPIRLRRPCRLFYPSQCRCLCLLPPHRLVLRREGRPIFDEFVPSNFLHVQAIGNARLTAGWRDVEVGNVINNGDDQR